MGQIAVMCHALIDYESTHVSVSFSGEMNPSCDVSGIGGYPAACSASLTARIH